MNAKLNITERAVISNMILMDYTLNEIEGILICVKGAKAYKDDKVNIIYHKEADNYSLMEY